MSEYPSAERLLAGPLGQWLEAQAAVREDAKQQASNRIFKSGTAENKNLTAPADEAKQSSGLLRLNNGIGGRSGRRKLTLVDWDGDGDLDLLANTKNVALLENTGTQNGFTTFENRGDLHRRALAGHTTCPTVVDWDKDGVPDLLAGAEDGRFYFLKNRREAAN